MLGNGQADVHAYVLFFGRELRGCALLSHLRTPLFGQVLVNQPIHEECLVGLLDRLVHHVPAEQKRPTQ